MANLKSVAIEDQVSVLMQEVSRLNEEIIKLHKYNEEQAKVMMSLVEVSKDAYLLLNEEITRVAKLRAEINPSLS